MKIAAVLVALNLGLTGPALAGSEQIIKQRAKDLRDQNNARQGVPASAPATPSTAPAQPAQPQQTSPQATPVYTMTPQQQAMARLQSSLAAIRPGNTLTPEMKKQLARDLSGVATGPSKPSPGTINKLADSLTVALSEKLLSTATRKRLLEDLQATLNPGKMGASQLQDVIVDVTKLFESNGIPKEQAAGIGKDLQAIAAETQKLAVK